MGEQAEAKRGFICFQIVQLYSIFSILEHGRSNLERVTGGRLDFYLLLSSRGKPQFYFV